MRVVLWFDLGKRVLVKFVYWLLTRHTVVDFRDIEEIFPYNSNLMLNMSIIHSIY